MTNDAVVLPKRDRELWIDQLRGTAIVLVVLLHGSEALRYFSTGLPEPINDFNQFFQPYRMPVLMFLSGIFLRASIRKGAPRFFAGKFYRIGWPYIVWSIIILIPAGDLTLRTLGEIIYFPPTYLWYLWFLLAFYTIAYALRSVPSWVLISVALVAAAFLPEAYRLEKFAFLFAFFIMGDWFSRNREFSYALVKKPWVIVLAAIGAIAVSVLSVIEVKVIYETVYVWGVLGAIVLAARFYPSLPDHGTGWLRVIGRHSIIMYVSHLVPMKIAGTLFASAGFTNPWLMYPALITIGLGTGVVLTSLYRKYSWFRLLFELPDRWLPKARLRAAAGAAT